MKKISMVIAVMSMLIMGVTANAEAMKMDNGHKTAKTITTTDSAAKIDMDSMTTGTAMKMDMCKCKDMEDMTTGGGMKMNKCKSMMGGMDMGGTTTGSAMGMKGDMTKSGKMHIKENPIEIIKIRLAKGEITTEQYKELKKILEDDGKKSEQKSKK